MAKEAAKQHGDPILKSRSRSREALKRRPIHEKQEQSDESGEEENETQDNSPLNPNSLHSPKLSEEERGKKFIRSKKESTVVEQPVQKETKSPFLIYFLICIFVCIGLFYFFKMKNGREAEVDVTKLVKDMENRFKHQPVMTYKFLKSQLKKVVNVTLEPSAPAIITLIANKGAETTASEFSQYVAEALAPGKYVEINDSTYWDNDPERIKLKIDDEITSKYQQDQLNVIIVDKLQKIPFKAAMIFHSYCDHESSPFKRAVFLFIVPLNEILPDDKNSRYLDSVAMSSLRKIWRDATDDEVDSLITRMTVAVINIR